MSSASPLRDLGLPVPPARLGPFRLVKRLGSGASAVSYLAEVEQPRAYAATGERVVLKIAQPATEPEARARFEQLLRQERASSLVSDAGIPRVHESLRMAFGGATLDCLVLEHVEGRSLREALDEDGPLGEAVARHVGARVAHALQALHAAGLAHGDMKPENVIVTRAHDVKVIDLGLARRHDEGSDGTFSGTLTHAAPEQLDGLGSSPATDLHALGVLLLEAVTGVNPLAAASVADVVRNRVGRASPNPRTISTALTPFLDAVIRRLLARDPLARFASAGDVASVLEAGEESSWWTHASGSTEPTRHARAFDALGVARDVRFAGRDDEMAALHRRLVEARDGRGGAVLLRGEAGVGKSRLACEFAEQAAALGEMAVLVATHAPHEAGSGVHAIGRALVAHLGAEGLEEALTRRLPSKPAAVALLLDMVVGRASPRTLDPTANERVTEAFVAIALALARESAVLWIVEDLHFASAVTRTLFLRLARAASERRILILGTTRPVLDAGFADKLAALGGAVEWDLERLDADAVASIVEHSLGVVQAARMGARIVALAGGNPLFAVKILESLDEGVAAAGADGVARLAIPPTLAAHLLERLKGLDDVPRSVASVAAVIGGDVDPDLVGRVLGLPRLAVLQALARLDRARILRACGTRFRFDHHALQEALDAAVPAPERASLHARIAWHHANRLPKGAPSGEDALFVSEHLVKAGRLHDAEPWLVPAFEHLRARQAHDLLADLGARVLSRPDELAHRTRAEVGLLLHGSQKTAGHHDARRGETIEAARTAALESGDAELSARARIAWCSWALDADKLGDAQSELDRLALDPAITDDKLRGGIGLLRGSVAFKGARHEAARRAWNDTLELARAAGDVLLQGRALGNLGVVASRLGEWDEAELQFELQLACGAEARDPWGEQRCLMNLANTARRSGRFGRALARLHALRATFDATASEEIRILADLIEAQVRGSEGRSADALAMLSRARADAVRHGLGPQQRTARLLFAEIHLDTGLPRVTIDEARPVLEMMERAGQAHGVAVPWMLIAEACDALGDPDAARGAARRARDAATGFDNPIAVNARAWLAALGDGDPDDIDVGAVDAESQLGALVHLHRAGGTRPRLAEALDIAERLTAHLDAPGRDLFWTGNRHARRIAAHRRS